MRTTSPSVLVEIDFKTHNTHTFSNGEEIQIEKKYRSDWNKRYSNPDSGWVVAIPESESIYDHPNILRPGDYVFFHFHTYSEHNEVHIDGKTYYRLNFANIYFKYDHETKEITPVNNFLLTQIISKDLNVQLPNGVILWGGARMEHKNKSVVAFKPPYITTVDVGDVVYHRPNTHYDIEIPDGRRLYRVREKDIIGIGELDNEKEERLSS